MSSQFGAPRLPHPSA
jgi:hypothetical protein